MAISDVLSESAAEIRQYMREQPEAYAGFKERLGALLDYMDTLRAQLDTPPPTLAEPPSSIETCRDCGVGEPCDETCPNWQ